MPTFINYFFTEYDYVSNATTRYHKSVREEAVFFIKEIKKGRIYDRWMGSVILPTGAKTRVVLTTIGGKMWLSAVNT